MCSSNYVCFHQKLNEELCDFKWDDHFNVELDVRDLGGHPDTTLRARLEHLLVGIRKKLFSWPLLVRCPGVQGEASSLVDQV